MCRFAEKSVTVVLSYGEAVEVPTAEVLDRLRECGEAAPSRREFLRTARVMALARLAHASDEMAEVRDLHRRLGAVEAALADLVARHDRYCVCPLCDVLRQGYEPGEIGGDFHANVRTLRATVARLRPFIRMTIERVGRGAAKPEGNAARRAEWIAEHEAAIRDAKAKVRRLRAIDAGPGPAAKARATRRKHAATCEACEA
ncbi:hypothetical protein [Limnoglobus roseus]|uniref:Uncharacterized protein n=1 Tax=Limnoglobus roseus TaxID=2598579 RepID=A0A5C1AFH4_9BACT|nr:hypothetical protein [Limnoglobus roseus]QEL15894.1 hypothetical protein PX52LOC_02830 [Limnoglobus roseus]